MKKQWGDVLAVLLLLTLGGGCQQQADFHREEAVRGGESQVQLTPTHFVKETDDYQAVLVAKSPPIRSGEERFQLQLSPVETNRPIAHQPLTARVFNPTEPTLTGATTTIHELAQPGLYEVQTEFPSPGTWSLVIQEASSGQELITFELNVGSTPPNV